MTRTINEIKLSMKEGNLAPEEIQKLMEDKRVMVRKIIKSYLKKLKLHEKLQAKESLM